jgi:glutaredoxin-like protein NrdH
MKLNRVSGENRGKVVLFALSTCVWCKKTKRLLGELGVEYSFVDVDLLEGDEKDEVVTQLVKWNPKQSFPTLVIEDKESIVGFNEEKIREVLGK